MPAPNAISQQQSFVSPYKLFLRHLIHGAFFIHIIEKHQNLTLLLSHYPSFHFFFVKFFIQAVQEEFSIELSLLVCEIYIWTYFKTMVNFTYLYFFSTLGI